MSNSAHRDFDKVAATWDQKPQRQLMSEAIASGIANSLHLSQKLNALEYGCGTGLTGLQLVDRLGHLTAVDTSEGMIAELQRKCQARNLKNVTPLLISPDSWILPAAEFDLIFSSMVLHHIKDIEPLFFNLHKSLTPGGFLALADLIQEDGTFHEDPTGVAHHGFNPKSLETMLRKLNFTNSKTQTVHEIQKNEKTYSLFLLTSQKPA